MTPAAAQRFVVLDSFRGLCALSVVLFHLHIWQSVGEWRFFRSAGLLVEFFFVLSGFVMAHRYYQRSMNGAGFGDFMISRSCRILPLHFATLLLMTALVFLRPVLFAEFTVEDLPDLFWSEGVRTQWVYNALLLQGWLPDANLFSFNGPSWSISVEYYIYIAFGLIVLWANRHSTAVFAGLVALCSLTTLLANTQIANSPGLRGLTCFFLGATIYALHLRIRQLHLARHWATLLEAATLLALYFMVAMKYPHKSYWATWGFAAAILIFAGERGQISAWLKHKPFLKLGQWSFSIYLVHFILLYIVNVLFAHYYPAWLKQVGQVRYIDSGSIALNNALLLLIVAGVLLCARWSFRWIEQPGMRLGKYWQSRRTRPALILAGAKI
ncbi:acyltransferase [Chitinibacter fontanus]|uniref:Acyltransferase n=1 Tax=Chitinibacter fontanus TaxID=1737446 RepID=A0A7D5ZGC6_9NEIS|nr:acyltransferase [Chitinibacter fontanus]QLI81409.1 acyltransferase [Chitinibacter fontanus]